MMPTFKAPDNSLHFISADDIAAGFGNLLPSGSVQITEEEADAIRNSPDKIMARINAERDNMLKRIRDEREIMLNRLNGLFNTEISDNAGTVTAYATEIMGIIKQLRDITKHPLVVAKLAYPYTATDLLNAANAAYVSIVHPASTRLKTEFAKVRV